MFKPKDQIAYIPLHANGDLTHPDVEFGFVTSVSFKGDTIFCRYWSKYNPAELRTKANSESTPANTLTHYLYTSQELVDILFHELGYS